MISVASSHAAPKRYWLKSVPSAVVVRQLDVLAEQEHITDADVLTHIAELDAREQFLSMGYSSMQDYCVRRLRMSENRANKRIRAGRVAREFPAIFEMIADGRLHLSAVILLSAHLTESTADDLLAAAAHRSKSELELMLAVRFPKVLPPVLAVDHENAGEFEVEVSPGTPPVPSAAVDSANAMGPLAARPAERESSASASLHAKFTPVSAECVALKGQLSMAAYEHFRRLRTLLGHRVPSGNAALVIEHALKLAADLLEKQKFAKGVRTRPGGHEPNGRYLPAEIRQAVCGRDGARCTFTGPDGTRCEAEVRLEYDHIVPLAKGGATTVANVRLLCRTHNQYEAKRVLGKERVAQARELAQRTRGRDQAAAAASASRVRAREVQRASRTEDAAGPTEAPAVLHRDDLPPPDETAAEREAARKARHDDIFAGLRGLGFTLDEARRGAEWVNTMPEASLEQCMTAALKDLTRSIVQRGERMARCSA